MRKCVFIFFIICFPIVAFALWGGFGRGTGDLTGDGAVGVPGVAMYISHVEIRIAVDKKTPEVDAVFADKLAEIWDWEHPGHLHEGPPGYDPQSPTAKQEFGEFVNQGWIVPDDDPDVLSYTVSDLQINFRIDNQWINKTRQDLQAAGLNVSKDLDIILNE